MPRRYYFAPIPGSREAPAMGFADGVTQGVQNFQNERERTHQGERQDAADQRQTLFDDMEINDYLQARGGGRGPMPTDTVELGRGGRGALPEFEAPDLFPRGGERRPAGFDDFMPAPRGAGGFDGPESFSMERPREGYEPVGPEGFGYVENPERREQRLYAQGQEREAAARGEFAGEVGPAATALMRPRGGEGEAMDDETYAGHVGTLLSRGVSLPQGGRGQDGFDPESDLIAGREKYLRDNELGVYRPNQGGGSGGSGTDRGAPNFSQAMDYLKELYSEYDEEDRLTGYSVSPEEMYQMAQNMARGGEQGFPGQGTEDEIDDEPLTEEEVVTVRNSLQSVPRRQWAGILRERGASDEEIRRITGGN